MTRDEVNEAVRDWLLTESGRPGELNKPPDNAGESWWILYPGVVVPMPGESMEPQNDRWYYFNVHCFGRDAKQAAWMSDKVNTTFIGRLNGDWAHPLTFDDGLTVYFREVITQGEIYPSGESTYRSVDTYRLAVGPVS